MNIVKYSNQIIDLSRYANFSTGKKQSPKHNPPIHNQQFKSKPVAIEKLFGKVAEEEG